LTAEEVTLYGIQVEKGLAIRSSIFNGFRLLRGITRGAGSQGGGALTRPAVTEGKQEDTIHSNEAVLGV